MKKLLIISALALAACISANAQVLVGIGYEWTRGIIKTGNIITKADPNNGIFVSGSYNFDLSSNFSIESGLTAEFFNERENNTLGKSVYTDIDLSVPVFVNYAFPLSNDFKLGVFVGPQFGCSVLSKETTTVGNISTDVNLLKDKNSRNFNIYATAGVFVDIAQNYRIRLEGFNSLLDYEKTDAYSLSYRGFAIGVSYKF